MLSQFLFYIHGLTLMRDKNESSHVGQWWFNHSLSSNVFIVTGCLFKACIKMQIQISKGGSKLAGWKSVDLSPVIHLSSSWFLMGQHGIPNLGFYKSQWLQHKGVTCWWRLVALSAVKLVLMLNTGILCQLPPVLPLPQHCRRACFNSKWWTVFMCLWSLVCFGIDWKGFNSHKNFN